MKDNCINLMFFPCIFCSKYDLYTKSVDVPDIESLMPYYQSLIDKYIPGEIEW